jgi:hypothetical protein
MEIDYLKLSQELLEAVRKQEDFFSPMGLLEQAPLWELSAQLDEDPKKKVFWLNIYNAYVQIILKADQSLYQDRDNFYTRKRIIIAGTRLSLDDIEHGILRRSKAKISFGYLNKPNISTAERKLRVSKVDPRIHFALNCGAGDSPAVRIFEPEYLEEQLDQATQDYLAAQVVYYAGKKEICVPKFFKWFLADFRGSRGVKRFLKRYGYEQPVKVVDLQVTFRPFDWSLRLGNFFETVK